MVQAATTPDGSTTVVVAFRADYYGRFAVYPEFARACSPRVTCSSDP